jgi:aldehyde:ferredoxin oxidoreductase
MSCSRTHVTTISSYTGILGDGNSGGSFAFQMKNSKIDQIVIVGKSDKPLYLLISPEKTELMDAFELWGLTTWKSADKLRSKHGRNCSVMGIGQAGENLVRSASTIVDKYCSAAKGSGAVWGSKFLKAICIFGKDRIPVSNPQVFDQLAKEDRDFFLNNPAYKNRLNKYGTHVGLEEWSPPTKYYSGSYDKETVPDQLRPESWKKYEVGRAGCPGCPIKCKNVFKIPTAPGEENREEFTEVGEGLEYEAIVCLGTNCGIEDPRTILAMVFLFDLCFFLFILLKKGKPF